MEHELLNPYALFAFVLANMVITAGYVYLAVRIVPKVRITLRRTKVGGIGFFLLCGTTHSDLALHALFDPGMEIGHWATSWHMLLMHIPLAVCVWLFVTGLFIEVGDWALVRGTDSDTESEESDG